MHASRLATLAKTKSIACTGLATRLHKRGLASLIDLSRAETLTFGPHDVAVFPNVISEEEHDSIVEEIAHSGQDRPLKRFRKRKYLEEHWDSVIVGYKELERPVVNWNPENRKVLSRIQTFIHEYLKQHVQGVGQDIQWLPPHIIELGKGGEIKPHVDSIKFSGEVVSGLSLLSTRVMRLRPEKEELPMYNDEDPSIYMTLPPRSLYIMCNHVRYHYAHSVEFSQEVPDKRISIIFRDALPFPGASSN
mmetsp:Transcript_12531/g.22717  ORF Transcript_12531/g.22717 Transcript_12531/m.22717 type:complete len:248 (-) Transcript_12531:1574-2317(-)